MRQAVRQDVPRRRLRLRLRLRAGWDLQDHAGRAGGGAGQPEPVGVQRADEGAVSHRRAARQHRAGPGQAVRGASRQRHRRQADLCRIPGREGGWVSWREEGMGSGVGCVCVCVCVCV